MIETAIFIPDTHLPYEDKKAYGLMLQAVERLRPDYAIILGDYLDCKSVSAHGLKPRERALMLRDEFDYGARKIKQLESSLPTHCKKHYIKGNHENRIERYFAKNAPALEGIYDFAAWMGLEDWRVTEYGDFLKLDHVAFTHDLGRAGENAHRHARKKVHGNIVIGHTHRMGVEYEGSLKGPHVGAHFGWLGSHAAHDDYKDKIGGMVDTVLGFGIGFRHVASRTWWLHACPIINGKVVIPSKPLLLK